MFILGISALDKDSTVTLFEDKTPIYAVAEERLSRIKHQDGFPWRSFDEALAFADIEAKDIDVVAYPFLTAWQEGAATLRQLIPYILNSLHESGLGGLSQRLNSFFKGILISDYSAYPGRGSGA